MLKLRTFVLFFTVVAAAHAEWNVLSVASEPGRAGIEHRHIVVENTGADLDLAIFSGKSCTLRVIDNPDGQTLAAVMKREKCACAVNGGYFDANFEPIGLRIVNEQVVAPLNDSQRARRTFAATATHDRALLGVSSEVSLADLATILVTTRIAGDSRIERAMNLDGGSSSAFWFARENGNAFSIPAQKSVRDFVAVAPK